MNETSHRDQLSRVLVSEANQNSGNPSLCSVGRAIRAIDRMTLHETHGEPTICYWQPPILLLNVELVQFRRLCFGVASIHMIRIFRRRTSCLHVLLGRGNRHDVYVRWRFVGCSARELVRVTTSLLGLDQNNGSTASACVDSGGILQT